MADELKGPVYREFDPSAYVGAVRGDLEPLALSAEAQIRWLAERHWTIEELWLKLTDEIDALPFAVHAGAVSAAAAAVVEELFRHMDSMTRELFA